MPAPTNTSFATATPLGNLPQTVTQDAYFSGTTYDLYFSITPTFTGVISIFGYGGDALVYRPRNGGNLGPAGAPTEIVAGRNIPILLPVTAGQEYFIECAKVSGNPTPAILTLVVERAPELNVPARSILVNDDTDGFPAAIISASDDYTVLRYLHPFPAGEGGDVLADGTALLSDLGDSNLKVYNSQLEEQTSVAFNIGFRPAVRAHHPTNTFYAGDASNPAQVKNISSAGAILSTTSLTGNSSIDGLAVSNDSTVIYHGRGLGNPVRRWVGGTNGTDLAASAGASYRNGYDIVVLPDDTILVSYFHNTTGEFFVRRYTDGGTLQQTYAIETTSSNNTPARIAFDVTDPNYFYAYTQPDNNTTRVRKITLSDGAVVFTRTNQRFEAGTYIGSETATPEKFGISDSCPFLVWPLSIVVADPDLNPSVPPSCCDGGCGCDRCCGSSRMLSSGRVGELGTPLEDSWSALTPDSSEGRLFPATGDPTYPEVWS
jgi:hypothetical protein